MLINYRENINYIFYLLSQQSFIWEPLKCKLHLGFLWQHYEEEKVVVEVQRMGSEKFSRVLLLLATTFSLEFFHHVAEEHKVIPQS